MSKSIKFYYVDEVGWWTHGWINKIIFKEEFLKQHLEGFEYAYDPEHFPGIYHGYATIQQVQGGERAIDHGYRHWVSLNRKLEHADFDIEHPATARIIRATYTLSEERGKR